MVVLAIHFDKLNVEKLGPIKGNVNINSNISIKDVKEQELGFGKDQAGVAFHFEFIAKYEPNVGNITLGGSLVMVLKAEEAKNVTGSWKKDKKVQPA